MLFHYLVSRCHLPFLANVNLSHANNCADHKQDQSLRLTYTVILVLWSATGSHHIP